MNFEERTLLIIDDDENYREVLARSLSRKGFVVTTAGTATEALVASQTHDPEYI